jgi:hypothetical protein
MVLFQEGQHTEHAATDYGQQPNVHPEGKRGIEIVLNIRGRPKVMGTLDYVRVFYLHIDKRAYTHVETHKPTHPHTHTHTHVHTNTPAGIVVEHDGHPRHLRHNLRSGSKSAVALGAGMQGTRAPSP